MAISMFNISVPIFVRHLNGLAHCLKKAQALYSEKKYDEGTLVNYRLFPDMFSFARQIQQAADHARNCAAALAGVESPAIEMNEKTLEGLFMKMGLKPDKPLAKRSPEKTGTTLKAQPVTFD